MALAGLLSACSLLGMGGIEDQPDREGQAILIDYLAAHTIEDLHKAASDGDAEALRMLGDCYRLAHSACGYDAETAASYYQKAVAAGSQRARVGLCKLAVDSLPPEPVMRDGMSQCVKAADAKVPEARYQLAAYALRKLPGATGHFPNPKAVLEKGVAEKSVFAMTQLAWLYSTRIVPPPDTKAADRLFGEAGKLGATSAGLPLIYKEFTAAGSNKEKLEVARRMADRPVLAFARERGFYGWMLMLAGAKGEGEPFMREAARSGLPEAELLLAFAIDEKALAAGGSSVETLLQDAANKGNPLALRYEISRAVEAGDDTNAVQLAQRASRSNMPDVADLVKSTKARIAARKNRAAALWSNSRQEEQTAVMPARAPGSDRCQTSGYGPGNWARCGPYADTCITTGYGKGNRAACGGLADRCVTTGYGPGNHAACGGMADRCQSTGYGPGNSVACGGMSDRCETTGYGKGNDAACGGKADRCVTTGYGAGNDAACGGLADRCESTGYGAGNVKACGGLARR